ncbi:MerR family transcriptional regulator [Streptomyces sp. NPDC054784]
MRIGELARRTGASVRSLRYYEEQGLLTSSRSASGQRRFTPDQVERVACIRQLYAAGLSSRTIYDLMPCSESPSPENSDRALERMERERERLSASIAELARARDALDGLMVLNRTHRAGLVDAAPR